MAIVFRRHRYEVPLVRVKLKGFFFFFKVVYTCVNVHTCVYLVINTLVVSLYILVLNFHLKSDVLVVLVY